MNNVPSLARPYIPDPLGAGPRAAGGNGSPAAAVHDDLDILRAIVEGTAGSTGEEFFQDLVRHLASAIGVPFAAISEFAGANTRVRTLAFWRGDKSKRISSMTSPAPRVRMSCVAGCANIPSA